VHKRGDILGRVGFRRHSFAVERTGDPVTRVIPVPGRSSTTIRTVLEAWRFRRRADLDFAADLERIGAADPPPNDP
jgi:hypothetical protein